MNSLVNYLLESGISLSLFALSFLLFLRKETFFRTNRMFLLGSVAFSLLLPVVAIPVYTAVPRTLPEVTVTPYRNLLETVIISSRQISGQVENFVLSSRLLVTVWLSGVVVMMVVFWIRILQIQVIIRKSRTEKREEFRLVLTGKDNPPFSFMKSLFIPENHTELPGYERIIRHELEHIRQGHTFDILLLDILLIFQWFNPLIWLLKRAVRENHEYLVDRAVLESGVSPEEYREILVSQASGIPVYAASHFNYSLLKNRFTMMTRIPSRKIAQAKLIAGIFIAFVLLVVFACEQKKKTADQGPAPDDTITLQKRDTGFAISGDPEELKRVSELLQSGRFEIVAEDKNGTNFLLLKEKEDNLPEGEEVFTEVDKMPEFPGGEEAFRSYIANAIDYPEPAVEKGIQGKVYVTFVVAKDGSVRNVKVIRGVDPVLDKEAIRVVSNLPKWIPGEQRGIKVNVSYTVPIRFALQ